MLNNLKNKCKDYIFSTFKNQIVDFVGDKYNTNPNTSHILIHKQLDFVKMNYQYEFDASIIPNDFYDRMLNDAKINLLKNCIDSIDVEEVDIDFHKKRIELCVYVGKI